MTGWVLLIAAELAVAFAACAAFAVVYGARWRRWYKFAAGRQLMAMSLITTAEAGSLLAVLLGIPVPVWVFGIGFGLLDVVSLTWLVLLLRTQREGVEP